MKKIKVKGMNINKIFLILIGLMLSGVMNAKISNPAQKPNIIVVLVDDLGWGDLACYGNRDIKTPHLDKMASQGAMFTQFYVNAAWCAPSRMAIMTGRFPVWNMFDFHKNGPEWREDGRPGRYLNPKKNNVAHVLKAQGYTTGHYGKWHLGTDDKSVPGANEYGFDEYCLFHQNTPSYYQRFVKGEFKGLVKDYKKDFRAHSTQIIVDDAIQFMEKNIKNPFYLNLWTIVPHAPLNPTKDQKMPYRKHFPDPNYVDSNGGALAIYYASVTEMDKQIGRLLNKIEELGIAENTIVLFTSDNGPEDVHIKNSTHSAAGSAGPFRGAKRSGYEGGVRMPFIVIWPGKINAGRVDTHSVISGIDFLPTFCALAGIDEKKEWKLDGEDISGILLGESRKRSTPIMWRNSMSDGPECGAQYNKSPMLSMREGEWMFFVNPDGTKKELYNIPQDPLELNNMVNEKPELAKAMEDKLMKWNVTLPYYDRVESWRPNRFDWSWPKENTGMIK
jgi:arylsulfatase A-like enzyme